MQKKKLAFLLTAVLLISPLTGIFSFQNTGGTSQITEVKAQQENQGYHGTIDNYYGFRGIRWNPLDLTWVTGINMIQDKMFEPLFQTPPKKPGQYDEMTGRLGKKAIPHIIKKDGITRRNGSFADDLDDKMIRWTVTLRKGYYWSDGTEITADDLIFTYQFDKWLINHASSNSIGDFMPTMQYYTSTKISDYKFNVTQGNTGLVDKYDPLWLTPWPKHVYGDAETWGGPSGQTFNVDNAWLQDWDLSAGDCIGYTVPGPDDDVFTASGPWIMSYVSGNSPSTTTKYIYRRNPVYYWSPYTSKGEVEHPRPSEYKNYTKHQDAIWPDCIGEKNPPKPIMWGSYADKLTYKYLDKQPLQWNAFKNNEIDFEGGTSASSRQDQLSDMGIKLHINPNLCNDQLQIQCNSTYILRQANFRRAIDWAIDKNALVQNILNGLGRPIDDPIPALYGDKWNWEPENHRYDAYPDKARNLATSLDKLQADSNGDGFIEYSNGTNVEIEYMYTKGTRIDEQVATLYKHNLEDAGIKVTTNPVSDPEYDSLTIGGQYETAGLSGWCFGYIPTWLMIWSSDWTYGYLQYRWDNQSYVNAVNNILQAESFDTAQSNAKKAQQIFYEQVPCPMLYWSEGASVYREDEWKGAVFPTFGSLVNDWTYRFMVKRTKEVKANAQGFNVANNEEISGSKTLSSSFSITTATDLTDKNISYVTLSVDHGTETIVSDWKTNETLSQRSSGTVYFSYTYDLDTTQYSNGKHLLTLTIRGLTTEPLNYGVLITVSNPKTITQRPLAIGGIASIITGIVVGLAVYITMRGKKPPAE